MISRGCFRTTRFARRRDSLTGNVSHPRYFNDSRQLRLRALASPRLSSRSHCPTGGRTLPSTPAGGRSDEPSRLRDWPRSLSVSAARCGGAAGGEGVSDRVPTVLVVFRDRV